MTKALTEAQIKALNICFDRQAPYMYTGDHKFAIPQKTAESLEKLGLIKFRASTGHRPQGIGSFAQWKLLLAGRQVICIGKMFNAFHK